MGMVQKRKKTHAGDTHYARKYRVRNRTRDLDQVRNVNAIGATCSSQELFQIDDDIQKKSEELINQPVNLEQTGMAQFYCVHCAKYFINDQAMQSHFKTKVHKRRLKALELEPYTIEESEKAAGHGSYVKAKKRVMETQPTKEEAKAGKRIKLEEAPEKVKKMQE